MMPLCNLTYFTVTHYKYYKLQALIFIANYEGMCFCGIATNLKIDN